MRETRNGKRGGSHVSRFPYLVSRELLIYPSAPNVVCNVIDQLIDDMSVRVIRIARRERWRAADERQAPDLLGLSRAAAPHDATGARVHEPHRQLHRDRRLDDRRETSGQPAARLHVRDLEMAEEGDRAGGRISGREYAGRVCRRELAQDRKSTRLNSSHVKISYA